jgi:hypothetical protein
MARRVEDIRHNREVLADPVRCEKIAKLYEAGVTQRGLLKRFSISKVTLEKIRKAAGLPRRPKPRDWAATVGDGA